MNFGFVFLNSTYIHRFLFEKNILLESQSNFTQPFFSRSYIFQNTNWPVVVSPPELAYSPLCTVCCNLCRKFLLICMRRGYYLSITIFFFPQILALQFDKKSSKGPKVGGNDASASLATCAQLQYHNKKLCSIIFSKCILLAICSRNCVWIWKGRNWKTVFFRLRH